MSQTYDVIVAGAGPIGLFLACELALAGASVIVLERDPSPDSPLKTAPLGVRGVNTLTLECLSRRGLLHKVFPAGSTGLQALVKRQKGPPVTTLPFKKTGGTQIGGHFAGIFLDVSKLELDRWKYRVNGPGLVPGPTTLADVQDAFTERAESLGVSILRGQALTKIVSGADEGSNGVVVEAESGESDEGKETKTFRARWLVGCDGGRSVVRHAGGFRVEGSEPKFTGYAARVDLANSDGVKPGFTTTDHGLYIAKTFGDALYLLDPDEGAYDRTQAVTREHLQAVLARVTGDPDIRITDMRLASSFTDRCRHAVHYRQGRILLAGDAAHTHATFGAQGMNLGMGDAMNLGWKLAATVRQEKAKGASSAVDTALLDTYDAERQPVAAQILELSRAQSLSIFPDIYGRAVRSLLGRILGTVDGVNLFVELFWGLGQQYDLGEAAMAQHPLVGRSAPDFELEESGAEEDEGKTTPRLNHKLETGRGLLVDLAGESALKALVGAGTKYAGRVDYLMPTVADKRGLQAFLVRPDGCVAWAVDEGAETDTSAVEAALEKWFAY